MAPRNVAPLRSVVLHHPHTPPPVQITATLPYKSLPPSHTKMVFKLFALALGVAAVQAMPEPLSFEDAVAVRGRLSLR